MCLALRLLLKFLRHLLEQQQQQVVQMVLEVLPVCEGGRSRLKVV